MENCYYHKVHYYETDRMGITHHSNYIRWMEEAREFALGSIGFGLTSLEKLGFTSPVVSVECEYKRTTTYDDEIKIEVSVEKYTGVKLFLSYIMTNVKTGETVVVGSSCNCFTGEGGRPIAIKKHFPEIDEALRKAAEEGPNRQAQL